METRRTDNAAEARRRASRKYYQNNKEKIRQRYLETRDRRRQWYIENHDEICRKRMERYYAARCVQ